MNTIRTSCQFHFLAVLIILTYFLPYFILGESAPIGMHDSLDFNFALLRFVADSTFIFSPSNTIIPGLIEGMPRGYLFFESS